MNQSNVTLGLVWFDDAGEELFAVDDCSAGVLAHLANAETIVGGEMSLPLVEHVRASSLKIDRDEPSLPRRIAG